jgi:hypothetical protein
MKYLFILLIALLGFSSCDTPTVTKKDLPIEVVKLKETQSFDTLLVIRTEQNTYLFEKNEYVGAYSNINEAAEVVIPLAIMVFILFIILVAIISNL